MPESVTSELPLHIKPVPGSTLTTVLLSVVVIAALYLGREVFVPIALAGLLSFVLAPPVGVLQRWYVPRSVAVIVVGLLAFAAIFGLGAVMVSQLNQLADELPRYQATLREKIQSLRGATTGTGTLERASQVLKDLGKEIDKPRIRSLNAPRGEGLSPDSPIPVEVRLPDPGALESLVALIRPLLYPLTTTGIVAIFVIFICSLWPTVVNTAFGVTQINKDFLNVARMLKMTRWQVMRHVLWPSVLPNIVTGLRISLGIAWMVIVAAEMLNGQDGIGFFCWDQYNAGSIALSILAMALIGSVGLIMNVAMLRLEKMVSHD